MTTDYVPGERRPLGRHSQFVQTYANGQPRDEWKPECDVCAADPVECLSGELYLCAEHLAVWHEAPVAGDFDHFLRWCAARIAKGEPLVYGGDR